MPNLDTLRAEFIKLRNTAAAAEAALFGMQAGILEVKKELGHIERLGEDGTKKQQELENLIKEERSIAVRLADMRGETEEAHRRLVKKEKPAEQYELLERDTPLVLLPVRLETKFQTNSQGLSQLLIRVYPDDIHVDTHEPGLTEEEVSWGEHYWKETWYAADKEKMLLAWEQLATRFGPRRAAWIAKTIEPKNYHPSQSHNPDKNAPEAPIFPTPLRRADSWSRAPRTSVLPDCWVALGYNEGTRIFTRGGNPIPDKLAVGPNPQELTSDHADDSSDSPVDPDIRWLIDFEAAEKVGMALRVNLPPAATGGLERLLVLGIKGSLDAKTSGKELESLLTAHHYTRGFAFVPQGTPTNNTGDFKSGYSGRDAAPPFSYHVEREGDASGPDENSDCYLTAKAFGLPSELFARIENGGGREQQDAQNMNTALWPATLGYFLEQMMADSFPEEAIRQIRRHFIDYVRARGPLPAWRIGDEPYGVLPVQLLPYHREINLKHNLSAAAGTEVPPLLAALWQVWEKAAELIPRVGAPGDPEQTLLEILSTDGVSSSYAARTLLGRDYLQHLFAFTGWSQEAVQAWWDESLKQAALGLKALEINWEPRLAWCVYDPPQAFELSDALVQDLPVSEIAPLTPNYIAYLRQSGYQQIRAEEFTAETPPDSLLYLLLRHSALLAYAEIAKIVLGRHGDDSFVARSMVEKWREAELVDIAAEEITPTLFRLLEQRGLPLTDGRSIGEYLEGLRNSDNPLFSRWLEFKQSLAQLEQRPSAVLERLLVETLDLCSHRLDAWITSAATAELAHLRDTKPTGIQLAGYGWLENIRPSAASPSAGYVHAPSLAHGVTAAVLHSGYLSREKNDADTSAFDLTSKRARLARWLLDGIRQGQSLGALLGYRFERGLHEQSKNNSQLALEQYIHVFREFAPLAADQHEEGESAVDAMPAANVVDGLRLLRTWKKDWQKKGIPFQQLKMAEISAPEKAAINAEIAGLANAVDALSDAMAAESIYQTVQGNPTRTAASLDAIARGEAPPPELEVTRTPRTGTTLTHRLIVLLGRGSSLPSGWAATPRSQADPRLNEWAGHILGIPGRVRCRARYLKPDKNEPLEGVEVIDVNLGELIADGPGLSPLDCLFLPEVSENSRYSELEQRLTCYLLNHRPAGVPEDGGLQIIFDRSPEWRQEDISFPEFFDLAAAVRALIIASRALEPADLLLPEDPDPGTGDCTLGDLEQRAREAVKALQKVHRELQEAITSFAALDETAALRDDSLEKLLSPLLCSTWFGIEAAVPEAAADRDVEYARRLLTRAQAVQKEFAEREEAVDSLMNTFGDSETPSKINYYKDLLRAVFGPAFLVLPLIRSADAEALQRTLADDHPQEEDPFQAVKLFQQAARVRTHLQRLYDMFMRAEALNGQTYLELKIARLGLPHAADRPDANGGISLVVHNADYVKGGTGAEEVKERVAGLFIDEWVEVIPNLEETTAVAFHFDEPGSRPPQAVLLALPPAGQRAWSLEALERTVLDTLKLAKIRGVDTDSLGELGHFLPALYFAYNVASDTVSSDFTRLAQKPAEEAE